MRHIASNRAAGGRLYFTTTREGEPIRQRRYYAGEGFYLMGNAEYAAAAGDAAALKRARGMYERIWALNHGAEDPVGLGPKNLPGVRPGRSLATYMGYLSHSALMRRCDPQNVALYDERARDCLRTVVRVFIKPDLRCTLEFVRPDGGVLHGFCSGREVSIGHDLETAWIMLEEAVYENSSELVENAAQVFDFAVEKGWDTRYGGLFYSVDCDGFPCESYEHDMKIWWPHAEMILSGADALPGDRQGKRTSTGSRRPGHTPWSTSPTSNLGNGSAISAGTACPPSRRPRARPLKVPARDPHDEQGDRDPPGARRRRPSDHLA